VRATGRPGVRFVARPQDLTHPAKVWISRDLVLYKEYRSDFGSSSPSRLQPSWATAGSDPWPSREVPQSRSDGTSRCWNRGIATEAATAARDPAFRRFAIARLVAIVHPEHIPSRRVAENIGMHDEKTTILDDYLAVIYTIERSSTRPGRRAAFEVKQCDTSSPPLCLPGAVDALRASSRAGRALRPRLPTRDCVPSHELGPHPRTASCTCPCRMRQECGGLARHLPPGHRGRCEARCVGTHRQVQQGVRAGFRESSSRVVGVEPGRRTVQRRAVGG